MVTVIMLTCALKLDLFRLQKCLRCQFQRFNNVARINIKWGYGNSAEKLPRIELNFMHLSY